MKQPEDRGHGDLTPDKALSKGKVESDKESSRQKFDTSLQCDLAKKSYKERIKRPRSRFGGKRGDIIQQPDSPGEIQKRLNSPN